MGKQRSEHQHVQPHQREPETKPQRGPMSLTEAIELPAVQNILPQARREVNQITPPQNGHVDDPILTMSECARRAGKTPPTIRRWIHDGLLKPVRHPSGIPGVRESEFNKFYGNSALAAQG